MKLTTSLAIAIVLFAAFVCVSTGFAQVNAPGTGKCAVITPIGVSPVNDAYGATINFGTIVPGSSAGMIDIGHDNSTFGTPSIPSGPGGTGPTVLTQANINPKAHAADWKVTGEASFVFEVTSSQPNTLSLSDGSATMTMTWLPAFVFVGGTGNGTTIFGAGQDPGAGAHQYTQWLSILNSNGLCEFSQGGGVEVGAHQPPGLYVGTWIETVAYN